MPCLLGFRRLSSISSARWIASELRLSIQILRIPRDRSGVLAGFSWPAQDSGSRGTLLHGRLQGPGHAGRGGSALSGFSHISAAHRVSQYTLQTGCKPLAREQGRRQSRSLPRALQPAPDPAAPAAVQQSNLAGPGKARTRRSSTVWDCCRPPPPPPTNPLCSPRLCPSFPQALLVAQRL